MREIKFRAWVNGEMIKDWYRVIPDRDGRLLSRPYLVIADSVMQYTGLKDKNGKEIYEGDVVEWDSLLADCITTEKRRIEIKYRAEYWEYLPNDPSRGGKAGFDLPGTSNMHTLEVIGNIYENPELLK